MYRVVVERSAEKDLRRLPLDARSRVTMHYAVSQTIRVR